MRTKIIPILLLMLVSSCAPMRRAERQVRTTVETKEEMLARIRTLTFEEESREIRELGKRFLSSYGETSEADEVRLIIGRADIELEFFEEARELVDPVIQREGADQTKGEAFLLMASIDYAEGLYRDAAAMLLHALQTELREGTHAEARADLTEIVALLPTQDLEELGDEFSSSPGIDIVLEKRLSFVQEEGDTAAARVIREQLSGIYAESKKKEIEPVEGVTLPAPSGKEGKKFLFRIGLLSPLNGRFSPFGEAFLRGASIALKEARKKGIEDVELVVADTRGDPLVARAAAEKLIEDEQVVAIVGGVLSSPTIAAAQVAEFNKTVHLSPVATEDGIGEIGGWVFQLEMPAEIEVISVAKMACERLGLRRIAFMSIDDIRSHHIERLFREEMELAGGEVCTSEFYTEGSTDFREHIDRIRNAGPEALYIASDTDDLILILPQLSFYEFGVQLLGTSAWDSRRLLRMAGRDMEGALFPGAIFSRRDEEHFIAATALLDERMDEVNPFVIGGYRGVRTILQALSVSGSGGEQLRKTIARKLDDKQHSFIELYSGRGIPFYTVRNERLEEYSVLKAPH